MFKNSWVVLLLSITFTVVSVGLTRLVSGEFHVLILGLGMYSILLVMYFYLRARKIPVAAGPNLPGVILLGVILFFSWQYQTIWPVFITMAFIGIIIPLLVIEADRQQSEKRSV